MLKLSSNPGLVSCLEQMSDFNIFGSFFCPRIMGNLERTRGHRFLPSPDPGWLWDFIGIFAKRVDLTELRISGLSGSGKVLSVFSDFALIEECGVCLLVRHLLSPVSFPHPN